MKSKMKSVSAVGVCFLTSFWMSLLFSLPQVLPSYSWGEGGGKTPPAAVQPAQQVLQIFLAWLWLLQAVGTWAQFSLSCGSPKEGGSVWATIITGAQFPAHHPPSTLWLVLSTLHSCSSLPTDKLPYFAPL